MSKLPVVSARELLRILYRERKVREQNIKLFTNMIMPMAKNQLKWNFEPHPTLGCMN